MEGILQSFEKKLKDIYDSKTEKFDFIQDRLKDLKQNLDTEIDSRGRMGILTLTSYLLFLREESVLRDVESGEKLYLDIWWAY